MGKDPVFAFASPSFHPSRMNGCPILRALCEGWDAKSLPASRSSRICRRSCVCICRCFRLCFYVVILSAAQNLRICFLSLPFCPSSPKGIRFRPRTRLCTKNKSPKRGKFSPHRVVVHKNQHRYIDHHNLPRKKPRSTAPKATNPLEKGGLR